MEFLKSILLILDRNEHEIREGMKKIIIFIITVITGFSILTKANCNEIREPVAYGIFYPESKTELEQNIKAYFETVTSPEIKNVKIFILPHSAHDYVGIPIAKALKSIQGEFNTVMIIGPSHLENSEGIAVNNNFYRTPLGTINLNNSKSQRLIQNIRSASFYPLAHKEEYTLEVLLPFIQFINKDFDLIPIILGKKLKESDLVNLSRVLAALWDRKTLIIGTANIFDKKIIPSITNYVEKTEDRDKLFKLIKNSQNICGKNSLLVTILTAQIIGYDKLRTIDSKKISDTDYSYISLSFSPHIY